MEDFTKSMKDGKNNWKKMVEAVNDPGKLGNTPNQYPELYAAGKTDIGGKQMDVGAGEHAQARTENPDGFVSSKAIDTQRVFTQEAANRILELTNKLYTNEYISKSRMKIYSASIDKNYDVLLDNLSSLKIDDLNFSGNAFVKQTREFILQTLPRVKTLHDSLWGPDSKGGIVAKLNNQIKTSMTSLMGTGEIHSAYVYIPDFTNTKYPDGSGTVQVATDKAENTLNSYSAWETYVLEQKNHLVYFLFEFIKANTTIPSNSLASKLQESIDNFREAKMNIPTATDTVGSNTQEYSYKGKPISFEGTNASESLRKFVKLLASAGTKSDGRAISLEAILNLFVSFNTTVAELQGVVALLRSLSEMLPVAQEKQNEIGRQLSAAQQIVIVGASAIIELNKFNLPGGLKEILAASTKEVISKFSDQTKTNDDKKQDVATDTKNGDTTNTDGGDLAPVGESRTGHGPGKIFDPYAQTKTLSEEKSPIDSVNRKHKQLNEGWKKYSNKGIKNTETPDKFNFLIG